MPFKNEAFKGAYPTTKSNPSARSIRICQQIATRKQLTLEVIDTSKCSTQEIQQTTLCRMFQLGQQLESQDKINVI
jgi:hypothetical protein